MRGMGYGNPAKKHTRTSLEFSPNGRFILSASLDNTIRLWEVRTSRCVRSFVGHVNAKYALNASFALITNNNAADEEDKGELPSLDQQESQVVLAGSESGQLCIWDLQTKELLCQIPAHRGEWKNTFSGYTS